MARAIPICAASILTKNRTPFIPISSMIFFLSYIQFPIIQGLLLFFTQSIHPNLGLPLTFLPSTFKFITSFVKCSVSILYLTRPPQNIHIYSNCQLFTPSYAKHELDKNNTPCIFQWSYRIFKFSPLKCNNAFLHYHPGF